MKINLILLILFGLISFFSLSGIYQTGSNEASVIVSKKVSEVLWDQKGAVTEDSFQNFHPSSFQLVNSLFSRPMTYVKTRNSIFPIFMQTRTGGLPYFVIRIFALLTSPSIGIVLFTWLMGLISLWFAWKYVEAKYQNGTMFLALSVVTPQMFYFLYGQFPDFHSTFAIFCGSLYLLGRPQTKKSSLGIGCLIGFALYLKLAFVLLLPVLGIVHFREFRERWKYVLTGMAPWMLFLLLTFHFQDLEKILLDNERGFWDLQHFAPQALVSFFVDFFLPGHLFAEIFAGFPTWEEIVIGPDYLCAAAGALVFFWYLRGKRLIALLVYLLGTILIGTGLNDDYFTYLAQGTLLFLILVCCSGKFSFRSPWIIGLLSLKLVATVHWAASYRAITHDLNGCLWTQDCLVKEWGSELASKPVLTMDFLDGGPIEFYSSEKIKPFHLFWKFSRRPSPQELLEFLQDFPQQEYYLLEAPGRKKATLASWFDLSEENVNSFLEKQGLLSVSEKSLSFPTLKRAYRLRLIKKATTP